MSEAFCSFPGARASARKLLSLSRLKFSRFASRARYRRCKCRITQASSQPATYWMFNKKHPAPSRPKSLSINCYFCSPPTHSGTECLIKKSLYSNCPHVSFVKPIPITSHLKHPSLDQAAGALSLQTSPLLSLTIQKLNFLWHCIKLSHQILI
jgi:hypothetical protein